jgi:hypothetical protein
MYCRSEKYGNKKLYVDGIEFASKKEANRYLELKILERAGKIHDLQTQVPFELIPKQDGERVCKYVADFVYFDNETGQKVVEDTKGLKTDVYIIKRKLMLYIHGIKIQEI